MRPAYPRLICQIWADERTLPAPKDILTGCGDRRKLLQSAPFIFPTPRQTDAKVADLFKTANAKLHAAAKSGDTAEVQRLIDKGANVNAKKEYGRTPLHYTALEKNAVEVAKLLIDNGAEVNAKKPNTA